jgi:hypothetical protein
MNVFIENLIDDAGYINPRSLAEALHTTIKEVATLSGLSPDTVAKKSRFRVDSQKILGK